MKLTHVEIKNYRSLFYDAEAEASFEVDLGDGVNAVTGPNNSGKSNLLRGIALALDESFEFDRSLDMPAVFSTWSKPTVTLTFQVPKKGAPSRERTLLKRLEEYEQAVNPKLTRRRTYAHRGEVRLRVAIESGDGTRGERRRMFIVPGVGARQLAGDDDLLVKALDQFDKCLQFVLIRSGESLESPLQGSFRDVLQTILRDELRTEFQEAEQSRASYVTALQEGVLESLRARIAEELSDLFPEVESVILEPDVRGLEDTLTAMRVRVCDKAITDLADKGTGVRGGLIVAILQHLATTSRRSIVFAVEEPESFLHPAAQEALRADLESLAARPDVSMLMTTHSPYVLSRDPDARVIAIEKDDEGRTCVASLTEGDKPMHDALGGLFRSSLIVDYLERAAQPPDAAGILVVEGYTDKSWLELAAARSGRSELLEGLKIVPASDGAHFGGAGGADIAVAHALVARVNSEVPVAVLLDNDEPGREGLATLARLNSKTKAWRPKKAVFSYDMAFDPSHKHIEWEAEDLWPSELLEAFVDEVGEEGILKGKVMRPKSLGGWHIDVTADGKRALDEYLHEHASESDCSHWVGILELIRSGMGLDD